VNEESSVEQRRAIYVACRRDPTSDRLYICTSEVDSQIVAFAFGGVEVFDRFATVAGGAPVRFPLNVLTRPEADELGCNWGAIDANSPDDDVIWWATIDEFLAAPWVGEHTIAVTCAKYNRGRGE
jgi:hypothetical protein